jgi:hypothetical protein
MGLNIQSLHVGDGGGGRGIHSNNLQMRMRPLLLDEFAP